MIVGGDDQEPHRTQGSGAAPDRQRPKILSAHFLQTNLHEPAQMMMILVWAGKMAMESALRKFAFCCAFASS